MREAGRRSQLIIVCGVPGAGKSTFARHAVARWNAVSYASEAFVSDLGEAARNASGDLTPQAISHAYSAMAAAAESSLKSCPLTLAVGSFRTEDQRRLFRAMADRLGARSTVLRIACAPEIAADRVLARRAQGEKGPDEPTIREIGAELDYAIDIDLLIDNSGSIELLKDKADIIMSRLIA